MSSYLYGNYINEMTLSYNNDVVLEFNVGDTIKNMIEKVKQAVVNLIDKIQAALAKCKDSKVKSAFSKILSKAKELLTRTNKVKETDPNAKDDLAEIKEAIQNVMINIKLAAPATSKVKTIEGKTIKEFMEKYKDKGYGVLFGEQKVVFDRPDVKKYLCFDSFTPDNYTTYVAIVMDDENMKIVDVRKWAAEGISDKLNNVFQGNKQVYIK